jgi:hypothetical protein
MLPEAALMVRESFHVIPRVSICGQIIIVQVRPPDPVPQTLLDQVAQHFILNF